MNSKSKSKSKAHRHSGSTKSAAVSSHRLTRLLKGRYTEFRGITDDDVKYYWAAYRLGALSALDPVLFSDTSAYSKDDFTLALAEAVNCRDLFVTLFADHKEGRGPVGCIGQSNPVGSRVLMITEVIWFPWASQRNILESAVNYVNDLRDEFTVLAYGDDRQNEATHDNGNGKRLYEHLCRYGIMRRVGTVHDFVAPGVTAAMFQSRRRKN